MARSALSAMFRSGHPLRAAGELAAIIVASCVYLGVLVSIFWF